MSFAYLPLFTGDYRRDTAHLTPLKHGIYLLLLMHCWDQKGPVPLDEQEAAGICNCRSADEIESLRYVLGKYFVRSEDGWYNDRMQREVERSENISRARSNAGRAGYEAKAKTIPKPKQLPELDQASVEQMPEKAQAIVKHLHLSPSPSPDYPQTKPINPEKTSRRRTATSPAFDAFWNLYPHCPQRSSKAISAKRWQSMRLDQIADRVMEALAACIAVPSWTKNGRAFVNAAEVWLNKRLWEQEIACVHDALLESIANDPRCA